VKGSENRHYLIESSSARNEQESFRSSKRRRHQAEKLIDVRYLRSGRMPASPREPAVTSGHPSFQQRRSLAYFYFSLSASSVNAAEKTGSRLIRRSLLGFVTLANISSRRPRHGCKAFPTFHALGQ
jgi:hypothetical protein